METLSATDAKREFGEVLLKAQKGPIGINKNGKPVAVMVSAETFNVPFGDIKSLAFRRREVILDIASAMETLDAQLPHEFTQ